MPIYFIHFVSNAGVIIDHNGKLLLDLDDAKAEAIAQIRKEMAAAVSFGKDISTHRAEIRNSSEELLATIRFKDALQRED